MTRFRYKAINRQKTEVTGYIEANSPRQAQENLRALGLLPVSVQKFGANVDKYKKFSLKMNEKIHFVSELNTMLSSGISVLEALNVILTHTKRPNIKIITSDLIDKIQNGSTLSAALAPYQTTFGDVILGLCKAGEQSGKLNETLSRAVTLLKKEDKNRSRIAKLSIYPIIVFVITVAFTLYFGMFGFPTIIEASNIAEKDIPALANALVKACDALKTHWFISIVVGFFIAKWIIKAIKRNAVGIVFNKFLLKFSAVKNCYLYLNLSSYFAILSSSYEAGIALTDGLELAASSISDKEIKESAREVAHMVAEGNSLSQAFMLSELLPDSWNVIIASGEVSGEMGKMFRDISIEIDKTIDDAIDVLMQFFQPLLMLIVGCIVGFFAILILQMTTASLFSIF